MFFLSSFLLLLPLFSILYFFWYYVWSCSVLFVPLLPWRRQQRHFMFQAMPTTTTNRGRLLTFWALKVIGVSVRQHTHSKSFVILRRSLVIMFWLCFLFLRVTAVADRVKRNDLSMHIPLYQKAAANKSWKGLLIWRKKSWLLREHPWVREGECNGIFHDEQQHI